MIKYRLLGVGMMLAITTGVVSCKETAEKAKETYNDNESSPADAASKGWIDLFNGKDFTGWKNVYDHGKLEVVDGEIHLTGDKKFFVTTEKKFSDFELEVEIMLPEVGPANSGVMFRCHVDENAKNRKVFGYQAECDPSPRGWTGRLYDEARRKWDLWSDEEKKAKGYRAPLGEWIKYRIVADGNHLRVWVNDKLTTDMKDDKDAKGHIGIQHHGEKGKTYKFRNIKIKELNK